MATPAGHLEGADREQFLKSIHGKNAFEGAAAGTAEMDELVSLAGSAHQLAARLSSELATRLFRDKSFLIIFFDTTYSRALTRG